MQLATRAATLLPEEPFGVQLLRREYERQRPCSGTRRGSAGGAPSTAARPNIRLYVREGLALPGGDCCVEEVAVLGNRVAWTSGCRVRKLFTLGSEVLQATWACFPGYSPDPVLCLLSGACLTTCSLGGELHECAVPPGLSAAWPAGEAGVLLGGPSSPTLYLLSHPLEEPSAVVADVSARAGRPSTYAGWAGEQVVWSSCELPYVATYSEAAGRLAIWATGTAQLVPELLGDLPDIPAATPLPMTLAGTAGGCAGGAVTGPLAGDVGGGAGGGTPGTGMALATPAGVATPASMISMFSFQPHAAAAGGRGGGAAVPAFPGAAAAAARQASPYPPSAAPSDMSMAISPASTFTPGPVGLPLHPQHPAYRYRHTPPPSAAAVAAAAPQQRQPMAAPSPYPPSEAPSDMSMAFTPAPTLAPNGSSQHLHPQQQPSPYPPSAAPSMAFTPAPAPAPTAAGQQPQPSPYPPSAAPSDMSMASATTGAATPATLGPTAAAASGLTPATGPVPMSIGPGVGGRFLSPYAGAVAPTPLPTPQAPVWPAAALGAAASPGYPAAGMGGVGGGGLPPGSVLKSSRKPAARTPDGFLSPHLFSPMPRAAAMAAAAAGAPAHSPYGGRSQLRQPAAQPPAAGTPYSQLGAAGGTPYSQLFPGSGAAAAAAAGPASTPGLMLGMGVDGVGGGGWLGGGGAALTAAARLAAAGGQAEERRVMVLLHEETLPQGCRPTEAVMATDLSGAPLLCVLCARQSRLFAFSITPNASPGAGAAATAVGSGGAQPSRPASGGRDRGGSTGGDSAAGGAARVALVGSIEAVAVAAVAATGARILEPSCCGLAVHKELLVLLPDGRLVLHRGLSPIFEVSLGGSPAPLGPATVSTATAPAGPAAATPAGASGAAGAVPATPASLAGTDMMLDDDSDMDHDHQDRAGSVQRSVPARSALCSGGGDGAASDGDDMMMSPPMAASAGPASAAAAGLRAASATALGATRGGAAPSPEAAVRSGALRSAAQAQPAPRVVGLCRGVGNTVVALVEQAPLPVPHQTPQARQPPPPLSSSALEVRLLLPFAPTCALAARALEVVRCAAPAPSYMLLLRRFHARRALATAAGGPAREWAALGGALLEWAVDPEAFTAGGSATAAVAAGSASAASGGGGHATSNVSGAAWTGPGNGVGGGYDPPATPFSTPLHTRRFAAMSLASPINPPPPRQQEQQRRPGLFPQHPLPPQPPQPLQPSDATGSRAGSRPDGACGAAGPAGLGPGSAWDRMLASETQSRLMAGRRRPGWMATAAAAASAAAKPKADPLGDLYALLGDASGGGSAAAAAAAQASTAPSPPLRPLPAAAQPLLAVLYGLHGLYEELKLDVLSWPQLTPLGCGLAAVAAALGLHPYWEHYARDLGPAALAAAGAPEPPLQGPQGLVLRPPADVYRILGRMVCGSSPDASELPSLLEPTAEKPTAAAAGAAGGDIAAAHTPSHPALPLTSRLLAAYGVLCECARSCASTMLEGSLKSQAAGESAAAASGSAAAATAAALETAVKAASERVVALVAQQGWDAGSLGRLPPGVALPLREAFQRCRASPPPGWPVQAYALIGREDIAATLAPSGVATAGPAAAADQRQRQQQQQATAQEPPQQLGQQPHKAGVPPMSVLGAGQGGGQAAAAVTAAPSFAAVLHHLPGLRTTRPDLASGSATAAAAATTPTLMVGGGGGVGVGGLGFEPNSASAGRGVSGGGPGGASPASSLFSFRQLPHFSLAAVTPSTGGTPYPYYGSVTAAAAAAARRSGLPRVPYRSSGGGAVAGSASRGALAALTPVSAAQAAQPVAVMAAAPPPPPPPPPRPPPSHLWHLWRPPYTARLQLPSHQLDLGVELEAARRLEGPAKQFESKHGMEGLTRGVSRLRFGRDGRLNEVISCLDSSHPLMLEGLGLHESDPEAPAKQQQQLLAAALRTMSLPLGRGAVALATGRPLPTEPTASVPSMCLAGLLPDSLSGHTVVNLDLSAAQPAPGGGAAADFTAWPEFHNGAAEGLRLSAGGCSDSLSRAWLAVATKPDVPSYTHAGLLMALGLTGHLDRLSWTDLYRYLSDEHDPTTIAVLVGMAAQRRGSMDPTVSRMLFLHLPARHPTSFPEIELSPLVQAAALMGVGLLYEGSAHRVMAETLLEEIGRRPLSPAAAAAFAADGAGGRGGIGAGGGLGGGAVPGGAALPPGASPLAVTSDREGYALAAGLALGLVVLGMGGSRAAAGLADLQLEERLTYYMLGSTDASAAARRAGGLAGSLGAGHYAAGGASGLDRVFAGGTGGAGAGGRGGGAKLGHAAELWGGDPAGPAAMAMPSTTRAGEGGAGANAAGGGNGQGVALVVLEPDNALNLSITSPAATLALALMYLRSNDAAIGARFALPDSLFGLDCVRPDCICLRALGRCLVMWDDIEPTAGWLQRSMPPLFRGPLERLIDRVLHHNTHPPSASGRRGGGRLSGGGGGDPNAVALAHVSALSGLCLAIGLKYAGSANSRAYETLRSVALSLLAAKRRVPEVAPSSTAAGGAAVATGAGQVAGGGPAAVGRLDRAPLEAALSATVLALSCVMAGTGHLPTFRLLQALSGRRHPASHHVLHSLGVGYGAHCAVSLALGFLFLGAGTHTFSTTNSAIAALVVALFPTLPHTPTDNRCHLQVFRHLYVLAARRRCLEAVDVDSQQLVYVPLTVTKQPPKIAPAAGAAAHDGQAAAAGTAGGAAAAAAAIWEESVLRASTKANLPWTPDGQLRPAPGVGLPGAPGTAFNSASGASGSPPMLEALHLEGDSPGPPIRMRSAAAGTGGGGASSPRRVPGSGPRLGGADGTTAGTPGGGFAGAAGAAAAAAAAAAAPPDRVVMEEDDEEELWDDEEPLMCVERVAPALLPEPHQTVHVAIRGTRYWPLRLDWSCRGATGVDGMGAAAAGGGGAAPAAGASSGGASGAGMATAAGAPPPATPYGLVPFAATPLPGGGGAGGAQQPWLPVTPPAAATAGGAAAGVTGITAPAAGTALTAPAADGGGGCTSGSSALGTVYRQLLLFVKKRSGSLSYSQDPSGIRSMLSHAFHKGGLLRVPLAEPLALPGSGAAAAGEHRASAGGDGGDAVRTRRQLDWGSDGGEQPGAAPLGPYDPERDEADTHMEPAAVHAQAVPSLAAAAGGGGGGNGGEEIGGGLDVVRLCATFSVDPSIMAFAQHVKAMRDLWLVAAEASAGADSGSVGSGGGVGGLRRGLVRLAPGGGGAVSESEAEQRRRRRRRQHRRRNGAELLSFCYSALSECITEEKTVALGVYLHLYCLAQRALALHPGEGFAIACDSFGSASGGGGSHASALGPALPAHNASYLAGAPVPLMAALRGLQLARAYGAGPLAAAAAKAAARGSVCGNADEQMLWRPLLQPAFLESVWCALQHRRWRPLGIMPPLGPASTTGVVRSGGCGDGANGGALGLYLRRGRLTLSADDFDNAAPGASRLAPAPELQACLAGCLALHAMPPLATVSAALAQLRQLPAWQQLRKLAEAGGGAGGQGGGVASSWALLPLLSLVLPGLSHEALMMLATAVSL